MLLPALLACAPVVPRTPPAVFTAERATGAEGSTAGLFLQGFAVRWEARPHRLRRLGFAAVGDTATGELRGELRAEARGGSWSDGRLGADRPLVSVRYGAVGGDGLRTTSGTVRVAVKGTRGKLGRSSARTVTPVDVPVPAELAGVPTAAWLTGFLVDTAPSHPDGYTPQQIAVELGEPVATPEGLAFDVTVDVDAAPVPDRRQSLAEWGATVDVSWLLVAAPGGAVRRIDVRRDIEDSIEPNETPGNREPLRVPIRVDALAGLVPIAGLSGFSVGLLEHGPVPGRYLRALAIGVEDERLDAARGVYEAQVALQFSNFGPVPRKVRVDASAAVTVLELPPGADLRRGRWIPEAQGFEYAVRYPELTPLSE